MCQNILPADRILHIAKLAGAEVDQVPMNQYNIPRGYDLVILDLDELGKRRLGEMKLPPDSRVVGYYSHVNKPLEEAATEAGVEAYSRQHFWEVLRKLFES